MTHKHAEFLRAIADGESLDNWSVHHCLGGCEYKTGEVVGCIINSPDNLIVRRKQVMHVVNGFTVPAPLRFAHAIGTEYFYPLLTHLHFWCRSEWCAGACEHLLLQRGLVHLTKEAAIANAKAMLGIDPAE